jgi:ribosomal protein L14E/L6E/L27E
MTLDGQVVEEAGGIVNEPPPKRQRKPKTKPVADHAAQQEETIQKEVAGNAEQLIGDRSNKATEIPASTAQNAPENTGSTLADPLANGFDARQFTEATLDVKGSGAEFVASHGIEETLFQLMRHEVQGACLVGSVMDALQVEKDRFKRLELDYKMAKTSIMDLTRQASETEAAKKKAWEEYAKCEADLKATQEAERKAFESLQAAEKTIKQLKQEAVAKDKSLATLVSTQKELAAVKADYQELEVTNLLTRAKSHRNCLKQVKHVLAKAGIEVDLSGVGIFKKVKDGDLVGVPDPEEENEDSESSDEETTGEGNADTQAGNGDQENEATNKEQGNRAGDSGSAEGDTDAA